MLTTNRMQASMLCPEKEPPAVPAVVVVSFVVTGAVVVGFAVLGALVVVAKTFTYTSTKLFSTCFPESAHDAPLHPQLRSLRATYEKYGERAHSFAHSWSDLPKLFGQCLLAAFAPPVHVVLALNSLYPTASFPDRHQPTNEVMMCP